MENERIVVQCGDAGHWVAKKSVMKDVEYCLVYWGVHGLFFVSHLVDGLFGTVTGPETVRHLW